MSDLGTIMWNLQKAQQDDKITDRGILDRLVFAGLYEARGTRDALKQIHERIERLHLLTRPKPGRQLAKHKGDCYGHPLCS